MGPQHRAVSDGRSACRCELAQGNCRLFVTSSPMPRRVSWVIAAGSSQEAHRKLAAVFPQPLRFSSLPVSERKANRLLLPTARSAECEGAERLAQAGAAPAGRRHPGCVWGGQAAPGGSPKGERTNCAHCLPHFPSALEMHSLVINLWPPAFTFFPLTPVSPAATGELCLRKSPFPSPKSPLGATAAPARLAGLSRASDAWMPGAHCPALPSLWHLAGMCH